MANPSVGAPTPGKTAVGADLTAADVGVLLTPRDLGGHEVALLGWLADAVRLGGLRPCIMAPTPALRQACTDRGLGHCLWRPAANAQAHTGSRRRTLLAWLRAWPRQRPLLLAPGVLHVDAWLLAAAVVHRRALWVYVPMTHTAQRMGYAAGWWRDQVLRPWLRQVQGWIVIDDTHAEALGHTWGCRGQVHVLPNLARVHGPGPGWPAAQPQGLLRVACVGRFDLHQKGLDWLAGLLHGQPNEALRCHWRFQGSGPGQAALQSLVTALGPHRASLVSHAPLDDALATCDVLLLPSRYEGLPLVALEATARGWPVVASRQAGLSALLPAGSLFEFGDGAGLAQALDKLRCPQARARAVDQARQRQDATGRQAQYQGALRTLCQALTNWPAPSPEAALRQHPGASC